MHLTFSTFQYISLLFPALGSESQYFLPLGGLQVCWKSIFILSYYFFTKDFSTFKHREKWVKKVKLTSFKGGGGFFSNCNFVINARAAKHQVKLGDTRSGEFSLGQGRVSHSPNSADKFVLT